jgi:hypothetical protein
LNRGVSAYDASVPIDDRQPLDVDSRGLVWIDRSPSS